jgi:hypothetical protein
MIDRAGKRRRRCAVRSRLVFSIAAIVILGSGCGGAEPPPTTPPPAEVATPAAPTASAAPTATAPPKPEPEPERLAPVPPLTPTEQAEFKAKCTPFAKAVEKAAEKASGPPIFRAADVLKDVASNPIPGLKDDARARCAELFEHDLKGYLLGTMRVGAIGNLGVLVHLVEQAVARNGKPCPDALPVPRKFEVLAHGVYTPTEDDYGDAGWKCLENASIVDHLLAQIRVTNDANAKTVTLSARTMPLRDGKMVEYLRVGHVDGTSVKWDPPATR